MAGPMRMPTRRFLFLAPRRKVTLAPIYLAVLGLLSLAVLALLVAAWPAASEPSMQRPVDTGGPGDARSSEGSYLPPPAPPKPSHSGTWM